MKKIIFFVHNLKLGGAQNSLLSLLEVIDYKKISVDLMVFDHSGLQETKIHRNVNLLEEKKIYKKYMIAEYNSIKTLKKNKNYLCLVWKIFAKILGLLKCIVINKRLVSRNQSNLYSWEIYKLFLPKIQKHYDVSIGLGGSATYASVDKVKSNMKIAWIHTDYKTYSKVHKISHSFDIKYFDILDKIIFVTESNEKSYSKLFPDYINKTTVIENILPVRKIKELSNERINDSKFTNDGITIVTVARIETAKALDRVPHVINKLKNDGLNFKWYIIGDGSGRFKIEKLIKKYNLEERLFILGFKNNPYPYMKACDIFVLPSLYEGKSITIEEAKSLGKPVITTNYPSAIDSVKNDIDGLIVDNNIQGIYEGVKKLVLNRNLRMRLGQGLGDKVRRNLESYNEFMGIVGLNE